MRWPELLGLVVAGLVGGTFLFLWLSVKLVVFVFSALFEALGA